MRVALVVAGPWPALRGSQVLVRHLADGLAGRGHAVRVVTYGARRGERPGPRPSRVALDAWLVARLLACVRRHRIDVVHAHNYEGAIAGLVVKGMTGVPVVYHGHSAMVEELPTYASGAPARRLLHRVGAWLDRNVPRRADFCIAVTEELGSQLHRAGVAAEALACIAPVGAPGELRAAPSSPAGGDASLVCYAGNLDGYQNLDFLLASFARVRAAVPAARLLLLTHADAGTHAARLAARGLGAGVEIVTARSYDEVRAHLAEAAVAVSPRCERSGFPMKLLNYMAAGKAIVACDGSAKGLVDGRTGRVVPGGDVDAFADAIAALLRDPAERARLGGAARAAVEDPAPWEHVLDRIEAIHRHVVAGARRALAPITVTE